MSERVRHFKSKMKLEALFLIIFLGFITDGYLAAECPARAIFAPIAEADGGYACVCRSNFYGDKCQYQAQNRSALEVDARWLKNNTASVTWNSVYGKEFRLSVRRTQHGTRGTSLFGKWRKAVMNSVSIAMESTEVKLENDQATFTARVGLMHHLSYEIRLVEVSSVEAYNLSASVFLDAHQEFAVDNESKLNSTPHQDKTCSWYICSARFFREIWKDVGTPCFNHGAIFAVLVIVFGTLILGSLLYIIVRQYKKCNGNKKVNQLSENGLKTTKASVTQLQGVCSRSCSEVVVTIDKACLSDKTVGIKTEPKSVIIDIPEIVVTAPLSEAEDQSESSADESSSDEGEYVLP